MINKIHLWQALKRHPIKHHKWGHKAARVGKSLNALMTTLDPSAATMKVDPPVSTLAGRCEAIKTGKEPYTEEQMRDRGPVEWESNKAFARAGNEWAERQRGR